VGAPQRTGNTKLKGVRIDATKKRHGPPPVKIVEQFKLRKTGGGGGGEGSTERG